MQRFLMLFVASLLVLATAGCALQEKKLSELDYLDRDKKFRYKDYEKRVLGDPKKNVSENKTPHIPNFSNILSAPVPPSVGQDKLVTLSVTEDVPLKDVLIELSRLAEVDMEIDSGIKGGIILSVRDKPFDQVIRRVAHMGGLRYKIEDGVLRVERDLPYQVDYVVDFLNIIRSNEGNVNINTQVIGGSSGGGGGSSGGSGGGGSGGGGSGGGGSSGGGGGLSTGSASTLTSSYEGDLWKSVEEGLKAIIESEIEGLSKVEKENTRSSRRASSDEGGKKKFLQINKQAGVISILATGKQHQRIKGYLDSIKRTVSAQVLIEAKIVEVELNDRYNSGIDWGQITESGLGIASSATFSPGIPATIADAFTLRGVRSIPFVITLLEQFGTSRTLSSPRIHAANNQQAVLTFAQNEVYFEIELDDETESSAGTDERRSLEVTSSIKTVPVGIILTLQPSINLETQEITMNIRPTLSRITAFKDDPAVSLALAVTGTANPGNLNNQIPVIEVRELDSILKIKSGEVMVIGGLMTDSNTNKDSGIPYANRVPVFGNAFKSVQKTNEVVETVILIKATIVPTQGLGEQDKRIYQEFTRDPRPLAF